MRASISSETLVSIHLQAPDVRTVSISEVLYLLWWDGGQRAEGPEDDRSQRGSLGSSIPLQQQPLCLWKHLAKWGTISLLFSERVLMRMDHLMAHMYQPNSCGAVLPYELCCVFKIIFVHSVCPFSQLLTELELEWLSRNLRQRHETLNSQRETVENINKISLKTTPPPEFPSVGVWIK